MNRLIPHSSFFILRPLLLRGLWFSLFCLFFSSAAEGDTPVNALFIGNSYTARHNLAETVGDFVEANESGLDFQPYTVIYAGSTLADHWRLGTANFVGINNLTTAEEKTTIRLPRKSGRCPEGRLRQERPQASPETPRQTRRKPRHLGPRHPPVLPRRPRRGKVPLPPIRSEVCQSRARPRRRQSHPLRNHPQHPER